MTNTRIANIAVDRQAGARTGITSVCTSHPLVIEAALAHGKINGTDVLIEATCNQVNQEGGYTGMTPADFRGLVGDIAARVGFDTNRLILGGDHLGPNPWKHLPADEAMARAEAMVDAYARAGFTKIHLDTSMGCAGESVALADETTAERAARLAKVAEAASTGSKPSYVIGTEVPVPGGALESIEHLEITTPEAALRTVEVHCAAFAAAGVEDGFARAVGVVVQPGVEFGNANVIAYDGQKARDLSAVLERMPQFVFEAHSTDYQSVDALAGLVRDGFAILKVGPWLTFALRETLYGLDQIAQVLDPAFAAHSLAKAMEQLMVREPGNWQKYYHGSDADLRIQRHFSYSDRIRYYWPHPDAQAAVQRLLTFLMGRKIPETLVSQYLAALYPSVAQGLIPPDSRSLQLASVSRVLDVYGQACGTAARAMP
jgi:D-tagatose-1,6-bisphosphate aldolase subunit GatZ/KbaZ